MDATVSGVEGAWAGIYDVLVRPIEAAYQTIVGIVHAISSAISSAAAAVSGLGGISGALGHLGLASGGIAGAASGGLRSNMTLVGEHGPELLQLSAGFRVYSNNQTQQMLAGAGGGGGNIYITLNVPPVANPAEVGRQVVNAIREFERGSGTSWRRT